MEITTGAAPMCDVSRGVGVPKDDALAVAWLRKAEVHGDADVQQQIESR
jgi:TPR repeat protein